MHWLFGILCENKVCRIWLIALRLWQINWYYSIIWIEFIFAGIFLLFFNLNGTIIVIFYWDHAFFLIFLPSFFVNRNGKRKLVHFFLNKSLECIHISIWRDNNDPEYLNIQIWTINRLLLSINALSSSDILYIYKGERRIYYRPV